MIDIEEAREWMRGVDNGNEAASNNVIRKIGEFLDELEATQKREASKDLRIKELESIVRIRGSQLADQRAHSIRMMAVAAYGTGIEERDISRMAEAYDRLAVIPVPPPSEVERG